MRVCWISGDRIAHIRLITLHWFAVQYPLVRRSEDRQEERSCSPLRSQTLSRSSHLVRKCPVDIGGLSAFYSRALPLSALEEQEAWSRYCYYLFPPRLSLHACARPSLFLSPALRGTHDGAPNLDLPLSSAFPLHSRRAVAHQANGSRTRREGEVHRLFREHLCMRQV